MLAHLVELSSLLVWLALAALWQSLAARFYVYVSFFFDH